MTPREKLIAIALAEVGTREEGGNNNGLRIREYQAASWLKPGSWPWCAAFCCWLLREWLKDPEVVREIKTTVGGPDFNVESWRCKDASAFGWEKWARAKGLRVLAFDEEPEPGDFVIYDFNGPKVSGGGHIGVVVENPPGVFFNIVEGNTNGKGERDSISGDGVWLKTRNKNTVLCFIRII